MSHTSHELAEEFPGRIDTIHDLKTKTRYFARLAEEYHRINRTIHRAETGVEPTDPTRKTNLRKCRVALKDDIAKLLDRASQA